MTTLELRDVNVRAGKTDLVQHIDLSVASGEWVSIIGPNGAGKSTLLRAIVGATSSTGTIQAGGNSVADLSRQERARTLAWVPQNPTIPAGFRVLDYVLLGRSPHRPLLSAERPEDLEITRSVLTKLHLDAFVERDVASLSGGERQRVVIGRALVQQAPIILLDEPTTALDLGHQQYVLSLLDSLRRDGLTVVSTMHDLTLAGHFADQVVLMAEGRIVAQGCAHDVLTEQNLATFYNADVQISYDNDDVIVVPRIRTHSLNSPTMETPL